MYMYYYIKEPKNASNKKSKKTKIIMIYQFISI